jgi:hypothetical protein
VSHFSDEEWADFVRELVKPEQKAEMRQHAGNCASCANMMQTWESLFAQGQQEADFTPPESAVRIAKSYMVISEARENVRPNAMQVLFDSLLQPATAGTRGTASARQILFQCEGFYVDLRIENNLKPGRVVLVGQILEAGTREAARQLKISLLSGNQSVLETSTNDFGEFQMEYLRGESQSLLIGTEICRIQLPVNES